MAEAEDVITDAARHAAIYAQSVWRRHRPRKAEPGVLLEDVVRRLELLVHAVFGQSLIIRPAQPPAPPSLLTVFFRRSEQPWPQHAVPANDGRHLFLPRRCRLPDTTQAMEAYRVSALQQGMRVVRGGAGQLALLDNPLQRQLYLVLEAQAADVQLTRLLPGLGVSVNAMRKLAHESRPPLSAFRGTRRTLEAFIRQLIANSEGTLSGTTVPTAADCAEQARQLAFSWTNEPTNGKLHDQSLWRDWWTGDLFPPPMLETAAESRFAEIAGAEDQPRTARLARRPEVRRKREGEDEDQQTGMLMVQTSQPEEHAEDPFGMQRPVDHDDQTDAGEFADSLSELPEARLVRTPTPAKEVLLSDDAPPTAPETMKVALTTEESRYWYPEWDIGARAYRLPGALVRLLSPDIGSQSWVDETLRTHRSTLHAIRNHFAMLRARRVHMMRQLDGDDLDLNAVVDAHADFRAGLPLSQALYQSTRVTRRDMAITLLVDVSGSTDAWVSANRRVIDVEREALLLVCNALESLGEPYAILTFSGQGPGNVAMRMLKSFNEAYTNDVALRIAALEPENYTRTGAAVRHATSTLMGQSAAHRLLLMLSDGKPNDMDEYDGAYGVGDMRQAVTEARTQGIQTFCLTIDHAAPDYLPGIFGSGQYALLPRPERLPTALLDWIKRLLTH